MLKPTTYHWCKLYSGRGWTFNRFNV